MSNKRVVITGYGIVSCIGDNKKEVLQSLKDVKSGISHCEEYEELGMRSHVHGKPKINIEENIFDFIIFSKEEYRSVFIN